MRLRKIRLAGFKSFVDPTTLIVPGNLVGVVGPNGCGKSNIIDAVTWVMGESSAKHLRGESLTDVIFNGSSMRQPVGQASVELVFDNSDNKVGGAYASYNEISIKRQITRDGFSTYFLNGTRCRRKDIQSLFLGTGLGPRSYAIIEQGVISRLIEAKPDELRAFIEEAAGISKYRERRRETEHRMRHTRDNLDRLNDIREELAKQVAHLQRQARSAERYQVLKQEERRYKAELLGLQWRDLRDQANGKAIVLREHENRVERGFAELRAVEAGITRQREECSAANEEHSRAQSHFYEVGGAISRLEQKIQHSEERVLGARQDLAAARTARQTADSQLQQDQAKLDELKGSSRKLEPELRGSRSGSTDAYDAMNEAERAIQSWQSEWDAFNEMAADLSRQMEIDAARSKFLEEGLEECKQRRLLLAQELEAAADPEREREMSRFGRELTGLDKSAADTRAELEKHQTELRGCRTALAESAERLAGIREELHATHSELVSIETLLRAQIPDDSDNVQAWLRAAGLGDVPRLAEGLKVDPEWGLAVETVLGHRLQDLCVPELERLTRSLHKLKTGRVGAVAPARDQRPAKDRRARLIDKLASASPAHPLLNGVLIADSVAAALSMRGELQPGESVVTRDGVWIGPDWAVVNRPADGLGGLLSRENRIKDLRLRRESLERQAGEQGKLLATLRIRVNAAEEAVAATQEKLNKLGETQSSVIGRHAEIRTRLEEIQRRSGQIRLELDDLKQSEQSDLEETAALAEHMSSTRVRQKQLDRQREQLQTLRDKHRGALEQARTRWQSTHQQSHELALRLESISSQRASLEQAIQRAGAQIGQLDSRIGELENDLEVARTPIPELKRSLEEILQAKIDAERELAASRNRVQMLEAAVRGGGQEQAVQEQRIQELRAALDAVRLEAKEVAVRRETTAEQLQSAGYTPESLLEAMEDGAEIGAWRERLDAVERRIQRLGPINLAAIDEFQQLNERKEYLDRQHADLTEALSTLENAIRKIDRESRTRFQETFDRLNGNLKEMFPVLFGGGHAYLEMTGDDLLETGVSVMARPPGKRNTNIHLLSGGEKALTAVALVFAIFKLNPAPFCILDEVDAPLDDTNVGRFSQLVAEMSKEVQFIFVTHNKITMEIAEQLLGVTMQEAGVSRLVSVDMDEAVQLAATA